MSRGKERLEQMYGDSHPGFGSYLECMTRANFTGLAVFTTVFSSTYIIQSLLKDKLLYSSKFYILSSTVVAAYLTYKVSKSKSASCQAAWLAVEEKSTYLTELENSSKAS